MVPKLEKKLERRGWGVSFEVCLVGAPIDLGLVRDGFIYAKWEAFSSTFADRRSFMAAALSMVAPD